MARVLQAHMRLWPDIPVVEAGSQQFQILTRDTMVTEAKLRQGQRKTLGSLEEGKWGGMGGIYIIKTVGQHPSQNEQTMG